MENILEKIVELAEKFWLRLDILLDLENMKAMDFLEPMLADILSNPLLIGLTVAVITITLYSIYKIKKIHTEKEKRLDALLQELDAAEEGDEIDLDQPLFPNQAPSYGEPNVNTPSEREEKDSDSEIYGDEFESSASGKEITISEDLDQTPHQIIHDDFSWDSSLEEWDELYENISEGLQEKDESTTDAPKLGDRATPSEGLDQSPLEVMDDDFNWDSTVEEWDELYDNVSEELRETDKSITTSSEGTTVSALGKEPDEPVPEEEESEEVSEFLEAVSALEKESDEPVPEAEIIAPPTISERIELSLEDIEVEPELQSDLATDVTTSEPPQPGMVATKSSAGPLLKSMLNSSVSAKTDALVSRLKTFQAELETRFNSLEIEPETITKALATKPLQNKQNKYQPAKVSYRSKPKSRSNKEYLSQLESFIFMAKQKNQRTDT